MVNGKSKYYRKEDFINSLNKIIKQIKNSNWSPNVIFSINHSWYLFITPLEFET